MTDLKGYQQDKLTIAVLGSHSALEVCRGAKDEGFSTLLVCQKGRERTYTEHFRTRGSGRNEEGVVDDVIVLEKFVDILKPAVQQQLRKLSAGEAPRNAKPLIEEFVAGPPVNLNYFYSPLKKRVELLGTDTRRQTNLDGLYRIPFSHGIPATFEEAGHISVTVLESMLESAFSMGERFADVTRKEKAQGIIGPFALQGAISASPKEFVIFDVSLRMPGSPGTQYTPYTQYLHGKGVSAGRRLAMELRHAVEQGRLPEVLT